MPPPFWSPSSSSHPQPPQNAHYHPTGVHQAVSAPPLKEVDSKAKKLREDYTCSIDRIIKKSLSDMDRQQCKQDVTGVFVHKALLVYVYVHLVRCDQRDIGKMNHFRQAVSTWKSWDALKQLTHHCKIRDALYEYMQPGCQMHSTWLRNKFPVVNEDKNGILGLIVHCGRAQETAFFGLSTKEQVHEGGGRMPWKECDVIVDLLHMYLTVFDIDKYFRERLLKHIFRLTRKSANFPTNLTLQVDQVNMSQNPIAGGSSATTIYEGSYNHSRVIIKLVGFKDGPSRDQYRKAISSEAILWSTLQHPNIVPFYGVMYPSESSVGLVSEFMDNGTIRSYLARTPHASHKALALDIAQALKYIHNLKPPVYHGDLKRDNILVDSHGHARLTDFGQAFASDSRQILDSSAVGRPQTPFQYMAPELLTADDNVHITSYTDMWAFGCVLYEIVTGHILFLNHSTRDFMNRIKGGNMPTLTKFSRTEDATLWKVAKQCWHVDPKDRLSARKAVDKL